MAQRTFLYTLSVLADMEKAAPGARDGVMRKLECSADELASWQNMADHMIIPLDPATGIYEQHQGFFDLPHIDVDAIPVEDFPLYHNWSYDRIYRNDMIKQPDVLMFMFLYSGSFSLAQKRANYDYYEPRWHPRVFALTVASLDLRRGAGAGAGGFRVLQLREPA